MIYLDKYPKILPEGNVILPDEILINQIFEVTHIGMTNVIPSIISKKKVIGYGVRLTKKG